MQLEKANKTLTGLQDNSQVSAQPDSGFPRHRRILDLTARSGGAALCYDALPLLRVLGP